jgi:hypothetical protein
MSTNEPQLLPPTSLALQVPQELVAAQQSLESVRSSAARLDEFILDSIRFSQEATVAFTSAGEFIVDSEASLQVADVAQALLKKEVSGWESRRLTLTRPLDDLKSAVMDPSRDGVINRKAAIELYQQKMSEYRVIKAAEAKQAQAKAERILREQKERQDAEARRLEEKAAKLKTPARAEALMREADEIRTAAAMMPDSVALAVSAPATVASSVSEQMEVDSFPDLKAFLHWLADRPEWHCILKLDPYTRPMQRFADQCHVLNVPGVKFKQRDVYRNKAR